MGTGPRSVVLLGKVGYTGPVPGHAQRRRLLSEGEQLGPYELISRVAAGGQSEVFLARQSGSHGIEKTVAVKCILPHLLDEPDFIEMFRDEARIAMRLDHPNVCTTFDFGEDGGRYYLAMEYLRGKSVAALTSEIRKHPEHRDAPQHPFYCARLIANACEGLHAAHEIADDDGRPLEVVHRDVSAANVFVTYAGAVKVVDFGIASAVGRLHRTETGVVKGKTAYMAPEQILSKPLDRRADIWSMGVVFWELLTGQRLFLKESGFETMRSALDDEIPAPSTINPRVPVEIDAIVLRALERDLDARYATARWMAQDINHFLASRGMAVGIAELADWMESLFPGSKDDIIPVSRSQSREVRATKARKRPWLWPVAGVLGIAVGAGVALFSASTEEQPIPKVAGPDRVGVARRAPDEAPVEPAPSEPTRSRADEPESDEARVTGAEAEEKEATAETAVAVAKEAEPAEPAPRRKIRRPRRRAKARSRPEVAAEPGRVGKVNVATPGGWADVYVGGKRLGRTPLRLELPVGQTTLELRPFGGLPAVRKRVVVSSEGLRRVVVPLDAR